MQSALTTAPPSGGAVVFGIRKKLGRETRDPDVGSSQQIELAGYASGLIPP
jgi:hypothetical protein